MFCAFVERLARTTRACGPRAGEEARDCMLSQASEKRAGFVAYNESGAVYVGDIDAINQTV